MRLIDADTLRESVVKATGCNDIAFDNCFPYWQFSKCIKEAPTIDAHNEIEAVRCGMCKYSEYSSTVTCAYRCKNTLSPCRGRVTFADFGCAYGERRE